MNTILMDLRYGLRMLLKKPAFTSIAVFTLALGIGANSALFSVVNAILLRPFPYDQPEELVIVWETQLARGLPFMFASPPNYDDWRTQQTVFEEMAAFAPRGFFLALEDEQTRLSGAQVSSTLFSVLQVQPRLGRTFTPEEEKLGSRVVVISHGLWQRSFGASPGVLGESITINEQPYTVVGVMPPEFNFPPPIDLEGTTLPERNELWVPLDTGQNRAQRGAHFMTVIARLNSGTSLEQADAEMKAIASRLEQQYPASNTGWQIALVPITRQILGKVDTALFVLFGAVAFVLLIACINVANMLLARSAARQREFAIRVALGASRWRLIRQLLTESMLIALAGGLAGLLLAYWGVKFIIGVAPQNMPRLEEASIDLTVAGFTLAVSFLTGVLAGVIPAVRGLTARLYQMLKEGGRVSSEGAGATWLRDGLVIAEVALSLALLVGAGLLVQSFVRLRGVDKGFQAENVGTLRVRLPLKFQQAAQRSAAFAELEQRLRSLPGVESAAFTSDIPIGADWQGTGFTIEGEPPLATGEERQINWAVITPGYLRTMEIQLVHGRNITEQDGPDSPKVLLINETMARQYFADSDPIGKRIFAGFSTQFARGIVGIVRDLKHADLQTAPTAQVFVPAQQMNVGGTLSLLVRSRRQPAALILATHDTIRDFERGITVYQVRTLEQVIDESIALPRFAMLLAGLFAAVAALLATVGIYGVVSYTISQHTHEIGVRMALGAQSRDILKLVVGQGMRPALIGIVIGIAGSFVLTRLMSNLLFGVHAADVTTFAAMAISMAGIALLACYIPARRATRLEPLIALRYE